MSKDQLTAGQALFCQEYVKDTNATKAAIRAGYSESTASRQGSRLLANGKIKAEVDRLLAEIAQRNAATVDRTVQEMARLGYGDVRKLYAEDGSIKPPHEWDDDTAAMVTSIEMDVRVVGKGADRQVIHFVKKVRVSEKNAAVANLARYLGLFRDSVELTGNPFSELMEFMRARGRRGLLDKK